jgi:predicted membrane protein
MFLGCQSATLRRTILRGMERSAVLAAGFLLVFLALNPVYWCNPVSTLSAAIAARESLLSAQVAAMRIAAPGLVMDSLPLRLLAVPYQLFFAPLGFWDIPNYAQITAASEGAYLSNPLNGLTSGTVLSILWCGLSLLGLVLAAARSMRRAGNGRMRILIVWFVSVVGGIVFEVPILWQRYYLPLIPVFVILASIAVSMIVQEVIRRIQQSRSASMDK